MTLVVFMAVLLLGVMGVVDVADDGFGYLTFGESPASAGLGEDVGEGALGA